jgi:UPF0716 protein FxsA
MLSMKGLIRIVDRTFLLRALYLALFYSLVPVGEIALLLYLKPYFGNYFLLALILFTELLGAVVAWRLIAKALRTVKEQMADGRYPSEGFAELAGSLLAGLFLVTPGFATVVLGLFLVISIVRRGVGRLMTSKMEHRLKELYEYMKL